MATFATHPLVFITYMMQYPNPGILEKIVIQFWYIKFFTESVSVRESSFNMTGGKMKILRGGLLRFLDTRKGGSEKKLGGPGKLVYFKTNRRWGGGG